MGETLLLPGPAGFAAGGEGGAFFGEEGGGVARVQAGSPGKEDP